MVREIPNESSPSVTVRKFHGLGDGYADFDDIRRSPELTEKLLDRALVELEGLAAKYQLITELVPVFELVRQVRVKVHR